MEQAAVPQAAHLQHPSPEPASPNYATPAGMRREEFRAMGTTISILLPENQVEVGAEVVRTLFSEWEQALSRFLPESELSQLNQHAGTPVAVSNLLYDVLATALTAAQATDGVYDPALLEQLEQVGYDRNFDDLPLNRFDPIIPGEPGGRWRGIKVDPIRRQVTLPAGIKLDFGGIAKGMAVDASIWRICTRAIYNQQWSMQEEISQSWDFHLLMSSGRLQYLVRSSTGLSHCIMEPLPLLVSLIATGNRAIYFATIYLTLVQVYQPRAISGRSPSWQTVANRQRWRQKSHLFLVRNLAPNFCTNIASPDCLYTRMARGKRWSHGLMILWRK